MGGVGSICVGKRKFVGGSRGGYTTLKGGEGGATRERDGNWNGPGGKKRHDGRREEGEEEKVENEAQEDGGGEWEYEVKEMSETRKAQERRRGSMKAKSTCTVEISLYSTKRG